MKMKSERPLLVNGVPQTEFETNEQHGKELIAKGLAVEVGGTSAKSTAPTAAVESNSAPAPAPSPAKATISKPKNT